MSAANEGKKSPIAKATEQVSQFVLEDRDRADRMTELPSPPQFMLGSSTMELPSPPQFILCPNAAAADLYAEITAPGGAKGDSGTDIRFPADLVIQPSAKNGGRPTVIDMEVRARLRCGYGFQPYQLVSRSSIGKTPLTLANAVGIIDRGYVGTLKVAIHNGSPEPHEVKRGDSLFQLVLPSLVPVPVHLVGLGHAYFAEDASLRGSGGLGSTGAGGTGAPKGP
jgi:dUTPase